MKTVLLLIFVIGFLSSCNNNDNNKYQKEADYLDSLCINKTNRIYSFVSDSNDIVLSITQDLSEYYYHVISAIHDGNEIGNAFSDYYNYCSEFEQLTLRTHLDDYLKIFDSKKVSKDQKIWEINNLHFRSLSIISDIQLDSKFIFDFAKVNSNNVREISSDSSIVTIEIVASNSGSVINGTINDLPTKFYYNNYGEIYTVISNQTYKGDTLRGELLFPLRGIDHSFNFPFVVPL